ncbi:hypothetical protein Tco_0371560 [Tanacetum coccineum]
MPVSTTGMVQEDIPSPVVVKDKGKGKMKESEDEQTKRTKLQLKQDRLGQEAVVRLQEELDEEERQRMARVHEAAQSFTEEEWENIRARVEADEELAQRLQAEERNKYNEVDQAKMLQLKRYSFDEIKELFETTMKRVNMFVPMETTVGGSASELEAGSSQATITDSADVGSSKRAAEAEFDHEGSKRQKTDEASGSVQEQPDEEELSQEDLQQMMMEVYTEESREYWKIIRVGNHTEAYQFFEDMLKVFDRDDLLKLWSLVKERFSSTEPSNHKERTLWVELKSSSGRERISIVKRSSDVDNEIIWRFVIKANKEEFKRVNKERKKGDDGDDNDGCGDDTRTRAHGDLCLRELAEKDV